MYFSSYSFFLFFPIACLVYYCLPGAVQSFWLLVCSIFFAASFGWQSVLFMILAAFIAYAGGIAIEKTGRKFVLLLFVAVCIGMLFYFKYLNFAVNSWQRILNLFGCQVSFSEYAVIVPVGISFYTFSAVGYLIDVYQKERKAEKNLLCFLLFMSFFPKFVQGPVERSSNLLQELKRRQGRKTRFQFENVETGLFKILYGYFLKLVVADNAGVFVDKVFDNWSSCGGTALTVATLLFSVQLYTDFAGYSYIAIGASKILGYDLLENFNTPYLAVSVADFWRRWHMSLTRWLRDYIYIPLGGNRKGKFRKYINIMVVFLVSGLWHGASWHFVFWGALNGFYQIAGSVLQPFRAKLCKIMRIDRKSFSHRLLKGIVTFFLVSFSWIFFRANGLRDAVGYIRRMLTTPSPWALVDGGLYEFGLNSVTFHMLLAAITTVILVDILKFKKVGVINRILGSGVWLRYFVVIGLLVWTLVCGKYGSGYSAAEFIYTRF